MKMSEDIRNTKRELMLNFNLYQILKPPSNEKIISKWKEEIQSIEKILNEGSCQKCTQELYMNINDLLIFEIPNEIIQKVNEILSNFASLRLITSKLCSITTTLSPLSTILSIIFINFDNF